MPDKQKSVFQTSEPHTPQGLIGYDLTFRSIDNHHPRNLNTEAAAHHGLLHLPPTLNLSGVTHVTVLALFASASQEQKYGPTHHKPNGASRRRLLLKPQVPAILAAGEFPEPWPTRRKRVEDTPLAYICLRAKGTPSIVGFLLASLGHPKIASFERKANHDKTHLAVRDTSQTEAPARHRACSYPCRAASSPDATTKSDGRRARQAAHGPRLTRKIFWQESSRVNHQTLARQTIGPHKRMSKGCRVSCIILGQT